MTKQAKELIAVLLAGAGTLYILWGATYTRQPLSGYGPSVRDPNWTAIGIGLGAIALATLVLFLVKPKKA
ncbi:MAG: hypothetical protein FWH51_01705 [Dehalococcoidia bacterium]|nr:hypothetical protein [Dehalococcoidia bacterium]